MDRGNTHTQLKPLFGTEVIENFLALRQPYTDLADEVPVRGARLCKECCLPRLLPVTRRNQRHHVCPLNAKHSVLKCPRLVYLDTATAWQVVCQLISTHGAHHDEKLSVHATIWTAINAQEEETRVANIQRNIQSRQNLQDLFSRAASGGPRGLADPNVYGNAMFEARRLFPDHQQLSRGPGPREMSPSHLGFREVLANPLHMPIDVTRTFTGRQTLESRWAPHRVDETRSFKGAPNLNDPIVANVRDVVNEGSLFARPQRTSPNQASGGTTTGNQTSPMFNWRSSGYGAEDVHGEA